MIKKSTKGFTIFFAALVGSLALAVGIAIYDLLVRELALSQIASQSQYATYAADTGAECALYWDFKYNNNGFTSIFAAPPSVTGLGAGAVLCNTQDFYTYGTPPNLYATQPTGWSNWSLSSSTDASLTVETIFTLDLPYGTQAGCAVVTVTKVGNPAATTIISQGRNTCNPKGVVQVERTLQVNY